MNIAFAPDEFDLSQLRDTLESPGYAQLRARYERIIDETRNELERCKPDDLVRLQTRIETLRVVLNVPAIVGAAVKAKRGRR